MVALLRGQRSRRAFLRGSGLAFAAGAPVLLAACGGDGGSGPTRTGSVDVDVLNSALDLEYTAVAIYRGGAPRLRGTALALGRRLGAQEQEHADALVQAIRALGGKPNKPRTAYDLPEFADQADVLSFANDFENTMISAYNDAIPKLSHAELRATAAAIMTSDAEHSSVLLGALGRPQVPAAFVTGRP